MFSDEKIINLYWERDEKAISATDEKYGAYCMKIAKQILGSLEDSKECINDTWLRAWNVMPPNRPTILRGFLAKITRNLSLDRYRASRALKRGGDQVSVCLEELSECVSDRETVETIVLKKQLEQSLNRFVRGLPEVERNVFIRRYFFLDTGADIANKYGLKEANVRKILSRTRIKLREYLQKEGFEL